jgi:hypothetical protein
MKPEIDKKYYIYYNPLRFAKSNDLAYEGPGIYSGDSRIENDGEILYWFTDLVSENGNNDMGWFSSEDILKEI